MTPAVAIAALPEPYRILGLRLLPLSLGRYRLLQRFGCAFVSDGEEGAQIDDLLIGLVICSMKVSEFSSWIQSAKAVKDMAKWGKRIRKEIRRDGAFDITAKARLFKTYLESACEIPRCWGSSQGGKTGAHWSHCIEVTLRAQLQWTQEEINESPLSKAISDYFRWAESEGLVTLMSDEDDEKAKANEAALMELSKVMEAKNGA